VCPLGSHEHLLSRSRSCYLAPCLAPLRLDQPCCLAPLRQSCLAQSLCLAPLRLVLSSTSFTQFVVARFAISLDSPFRRHCCWIRCQSILTLVAPCALVSVAMASVVTACRCACSRREGALVSIGLDFVTLDSILSLVFVALNFVEFVGWTLVPIYLCGGTVAVFYCACLFGEVAYYYW
jgi:hypothetical protein